MSTTEHPTDHLNALRFRLHNEKERLEAASNPVEIEHRKELVRSIHKELLAEIYLLKTRGVMVAESASIEIMIDKFMKDE